MVAIFAGAGTGLERGSGNIVGAGGTIGSAAFGRGGSQLRVNAANGNLVIARQDEFLSAVGDDVAVLRVYNSQGDLSDTNGDNWRMGEHRALRTLTGSANASGSSIDRVGADGSVITYRWNGSAYSSTDGAGAHDRITWDGTDWRWQDGDSATVETYGADLRLAKSTDRSGHVTQFTYSDGRLSRITGHDGGYLDYGWSGNLITGITSVSQGTTTLRTRYGYDAQGRLSTVTVDRTVQDNSIADGNVYTTTYGYRGDSRLIASIGETDGSSIQFDYDAANRVTSLTQLVGGTVSRTTTLTYNAGNTVVTDPLGQATTLSHDGAGRLTGITAPPAVAGGAAQQVQFGYNANGDLTSVTDAAGVGASYGHDANGNIVRQTDRMGDTITRTYSAANQILTETQTGSDRTSGATAHTTRYVYDTLNRLRYVISADGRVRETRYNGAGLVTLSVDYTANRYDISGLSATTAPSESQLNGWRGTTDRTQSAITQFLYDARGNLAQKVGFGATNADGTINRDFGYTHEYFVYDAAGQLLSRGPAGRATESFAYDGLGRVIQSTDTDGGTTRITFNDAATQTTVTLANGFVQTSTYARSGELLSLTESGANVTGGTATSQYDRAGRLRIATDATGRKTHYVYDGAGRRVADIAGNGEMTEYRYDANDRIVAMVRYATTVAIPAALNDPDATVSLASLRPAANASGDQWDWTVYDREGRVVQTIDGDGSTSVNTYDGSGRLVATTTYVAKLTTSQIAAFRSTAPTTVTLPSTSAGDSVSRVFYDNDGNLIGRLDGEGYLSQIVLDAGGRKVQEIAHASVTAANLRASGSFQALIDSAVAAGTGNDRSTRFVYDQQGYLRYTIDAIGRVTELGYHYDGWKWSAFGPVRQTTRYADTLGPLSSYSIDAVRSAVAGLASNPANRTDWAVYDNSGRLAYSIDATGAVIGYRYDNRGQMIARTEYAALRSTTTLPSFDAMADWARNAKGGSDRTTRQYYDARGGLRYTIDAEGYVTGNDYDAAGRVVFTGRWDDRVAADDGWTTASVGNATTGDYSATTRSYDARGRLTLLSDNAGRSTRYLYRANGQLVWEIRSPGTGDESKTFYDYDLAGRRSWMSAANGTPEQTPTAYFYDGLGNLVRTIDGQGVAIAWSYDRAGQMVAETRAYNLTTRHEYNAFGDRVRTIDAGGGSTYRYVDRLGRTVAVRDAEDYVTETGYTRFGEIEWVKRAYNRATDTAGVATLPGGYGTHDLDATTRFEYDRLGRVTGTIDAEGYAERYTLDAFGNRATVTNKLGGVTVNGYDRRGLLVSQTLPITSVTQEGQVRATSVVNRFEYDARGNRVRTVEAEGLAEERATRNVYDRADRLIEVRGSAVQYLDGAFRSQSTDLVASYRYDTRGNVIERRDANGARTLFYYDDLNQNVAEIGATGTLSTYAYNKVGFRIASRVYATRVALPTDPGGPPPAAPDGEYRETTASYDAVGRLRSSSSGEVRTGRWNGSTFVLTTDAATTAYKYDAAGNVVAETDAEGATAYSFYDRNGRKTAQVDKEGYVTRWTYDAEGNVRSERRHATQTSGAAIGVLPAVADSAADRITEFGYDRNGNRIFERRLNVEWVSVSGATIQSATGSSTVEYTYNGLGKITSKTEATGETTRFTFDAMGRLTEEAHPSFFDHSGNEVRSRLRFSYDGTGNLTRTDQGDQEYAGGFRTTKYFYGATGRLDAKHDADGGQTRYGHDAAGNVVQETRFRKNAGGDILTEAMLYVRDLSGRVTSQGMGRWNGTGWDRGDIQQMAYNAYGEVSQRGMNGGWQEQFAYDRNGRLFRSNAGDGVWRYFVYDKLGNQTAAIESEGASIDGRTLEGMLSVATDDFTHALGGAYVAGIRTTLNVYDRRGQSIRTIQPNRELIDPRYVEYPGGSNVDIDMARAYTAFGEVAWERDARGFYTHMAYNTMGRMLWRQRPQVEITDENGQTRSVNPTEYLHYDLSGRAVASRDARGALTTRYLLAGTGYNGSEALVTRETTADGASVNRRYDQFLDLRASSNGIARWSYMNYDAMGRLTQVTRPGGQSEYYAYDMLGQRIRRWDSFYGTANAEQTDYDMQGRVVRQVSAGGSEGIADVTTTTYDWSSTLATEGMGTFGGWVTTTTYANGRTSIGHADMFGRTVETTDLGYHVSSFSFDLAGRMTARYLGDRYSGERTDYHYLNTGLLGSISEGENKSDTAPNNPGQDWNYESVTYGYDKSGNRTNEYHSVDNGRWQNEYDYNGDPNYVYQQYGMSHQNATAQYDALGRMTRWDDHGGYTALEYKYDENGNIRRSLANFRASDSSNQVTTQDYWYTYDAMNRVTIAKGQLVGSQIARGYTGVGYQYDLAGQRVLSSRTINTMAWIQGPNEDGSTVVFYDATQQEEYGYDVDGRLTSVRIGTQGYVDNGDGTVTITDPSKFELKATFGYDGIGRQTSQTDYLYDGDRNSAVAWQRVATFNARGQVTNETSWQRQGNDTIRTITTNGYGSGENYALGSIVQASNVVYKNNKSEYSANTNNYYEWFSNAAISIVHYKQDKQDLRVSSYFYRGNGELSFTEIADGRPRNVSYFTNMTGQVIERSEYARNGGTGNPREKWYRFNGRTLGYVGNNGTQDTSYQESIDSRTRTQGTGPFAGGSNYASPYADFDQSVAPITSYAQGSGGGSYTVRGGDTLSGIATQLWGDAGLWYKLAEANGLSGASALIAGQSLTIPTGVQKSTHNAATFTPYDPAEAMGDTSPNVQPKAKKNKCGAFGAILLTVIAVAVTALTAVALPAAVGPILTGAISATAGSVVSQAVGVATGIQDQFDWKGVAISALSGAVGGAIGSVSPFGSGKDVLTGFANGAVRGALGSFVTQGLAVATHLQKEMNWLGVATGAVGSGVAGGLGNVLKLESLRDDLTPGNVARTALTNTAAGIANAATRALATGTSFGDSVLAALPDVIGQTVGGLVAAGLNGSSQRAAAPRSPAAPGADDGAEGPEYPNGGASDRVWSVDDEVALRGQSGDRYDVAGSGNVTEQGNDILVSSDKYKVSLFRAMNQYQLERYEKEYGGVSFVEGARWALGLVEPTYSSYHLSSYDGPLGSYFVQQGRPFQGFSYLGKDYATQAAAVAAGIPTIQSGPSQRSSYEAQRGAAFFASIGQGPFGLGPIAYVTGFSPQTISASGQLDQALGGLAIGFAVGGYRAPLLGPRQPSVTTSAPVYGGPAVVSLEAEALSPFTQRYLTESGGRWGSATTRQQNYAISQELKVRGYSVRNGGGIGPEEYIPGQGPGTRGGTFVDITSTAPNGRTVRIQTVTTRTLSDGSVVPTTAESAAATRIRLAFPKDKLILVPKR